MEGVQSYTDKLRKTYRQSLDVILPFTSHEAVVYCNDEEFEHFINDQQSVKDLQACIYLLERHIDLQQEIIQGLTHLQEIHRYDKLSKDYNDVVEKLMTAQSKLAVLRSRTVRCLTKQIAQRCGDSDLQLPPWSMGVVNKITELNDSVINGRPLSSELNITVQESENLESEQSVTNPKGLSNSSSKPIAEFNGVETSAADTLQDFHENGELDSGITGVDGMPNSDGSTICCNELYAVPKNSLQSLENYSPLGQDNNVSDLTLSGNVDNIHAPSESHPLLNGNESDIPFQGSVSGHQLVSSSEPERFHIVDNDSDSSKSRSVEPKGQSQSNGCSRTIVEPVDEIVTVEVFEKSSNHRDGDRKEKAKESFVSYCNLAKPSEHSNMKEAVGETPACKSNLVKEEVSDQIVPDLKAKTLSWDPGMLIRQILGHVKSIKSQLDEDTYSDEIQMAGYLEKLPVNQKKASLMKSWRKRYFKILNGKLFYFEDHRNATPISFIKLGGSQVKELGNKSLEVVEREDLGGKLLVMRCATWSELQDWRKALESQAKLKVKRNHYELQPEKLPVIIVDFGSSSIKAGFLEDDVWPQVLMPSVYAINKENSKNISYGYEALDPSVRNVSKLFFPLRSAVTVGKSALDPNELIGFLEIIFRELQVDPSHHQVLMTTPVNLKDQDKERLVEILLDHFQVAGVHMKSQAILSMYSYSATRGIVVNIGDNIDIVPIEDGYIIEAGMSSLPYGGRHITDHFIRMLSLSGHRYFSEFENYIGEYLKVKTSYISQDYKHELERDSDNDSAVVDMSNFDLPNGDALVRVSKERFAAYEGLFNPELWGKDTPGLAQLVYQAIMACSIDSRKEMCRNIYLSGAATKVEGFPERLQTEVSRKFPSSVAVQVHASSDRQFAAFIGAAVLASLDSFDDMCITREEWEEIGADALKKWDSV